MKTAFSQTRHATSLPQNTQIMKRLALFFALLSTTPLWAQLVEQPPYTNADIPQYVQYLNLTDSFPNLRFNIRGEYSTIVFEQDTVDYVSLRLNSWDDTNRVHSWINLNPGSWPSLTIFARGQDVIQIHSRHKDLYIYAQYSNHIYIHSSCDSVLRYDNINIQADDHCIVEFINPISVANKISLLAQNSAIIRYFQYTCKTYEECTRDFGSIQGFLRNGENVWQSLKGYHIETNSSKRSHPTKMGWYNASDRFHINLYGGWDTYILRGGQETVPAKLALGNYQAEMTYDLVAKTHFAFGIGLGYSHSNFALRDPYVRYYETLPFYDEETGRLMWYNPNYDLLSEEIPFGEEQYWHSQFILRQLTLPIHFSYYCNKDHTKGLHFGADLVFGLLRKGNVHQRYGKSLGTGTDEYTGDPYETFLNYSKYDYFECDPQIDIRLSAGWGPWNLFAQYGLMRLVPSWGKNSLAFGLKVSL